MPTVSPEQYGLMQARAHGTSNAVGGPSPAVAQKFIDETPKVRRSQFAKKLAKKRNKKQYGQ